MDSEPPTWSLLTRLIHAGERAEPSAGRPTATPIYTTATYVYPDAAALDHHWNEMPDDVGDAFDIHIDDLAEFFGADFPERRVAVDDTGVVQHQIRRAARFEQPFRPRLDLVVGRHVHSIELVPFAELPSQISEVLFRATATEHHMAEPDELLRHGASQPARYAGDDQGFHGRVRHRFRRQ